MIVITDPVEMWRYANDHSGASRGLVPTMGALHPGHEALLQHSRGDNDLTTLSIFVNPIQFNVTDDYEKYPRTIERDLSIAEHHGVDVVYMPTVESMYPAGFASYIEPASSSRPMEGRMRPGHFKGVTTVVAKLFHATLPHRAYFGKKDYQQLAVIRQMVDELDFGLEVVGVDTVREDDGLAMSSRNVRLSPAARLDAPIIHRGLAAAARSHSAGQTDPARLVAAFMDVVASSDLVDVEYVEVRCARTLASVETVTEPVVMFVAAWYDDVRLIDNIELVPGASPVD